MNLNQRKTAVVAVHLQGDVVTHQGAFGGFFAAMVDHTGVLERSQDLLVAARAAGASVAYTRISFRQGHTELIANNQLFAVVDQQKCCLEGSPGASIVPEVAPEPGDIDVAHHRVSG